MAIFVAGCPERGLDAHELECIHSVETYVWIYFFAVAQNLLRCLRLRLSDNELRWALSSLSFLELVHRASVESQNLWEVSRCIGTAPSIFLSIVAMLG